MADSDIDIISKSKKYWNDFSEEYFRGHFHQRKRLSLRPLVTWGFGPALASGNICRNKMS